MCWSRATLVTVLILAAGCVLVAGSEMGGLASCGERDAMLSIATIFFNYMIAP
jgi:hypothetical protein